MGQENVEVVRRAFDIFKAGARNGDPGAAIDRSLGEALIVSTLALTGGKEACPGAARVGAYVGRQGYVEFMRAFTEGFEGCDIEVEQVIDAGNDRVAVFTRHQVAGKRGGCPARCEPARSAPLWGATLCGWSCFVNRAKPSKPPG